MKDKVLEIIDSTAENLRMLYGESIFLDAKIEVLTDIRIKVSQMQLPVKPACEKKCENCLYCREGLVCEHIRNRAMMILEDDERFFIYPNFGCNNFESKSV